MYWVSWYGNRNAFLLSPRSCFDLVIPTCIHVKKSYSYIAVYVNKQNRYGEDRCTAAGAGMSPLNCLNLKSQANDYIDLYMEIDYKEDCLLSEAMYIRRAYPRHILLLGTPQGFWSEAFLGESMKKFQRSDIDCIESNDRIKLLRFMNTVTFRFGKKTHIKITVDSRKYIKNSLSCFRILDLIELRQDICNGAELFEAASSLILDHHNDENSLDRSCTQRF